MISQQNPDGSWSQAQPLGWQGGLYWESVAGRELYVADLVGPDRTVATTRSRWKWSLLLKMLALTLRHLPEHNRVRRVRR